MAGVPSGPDTPLGLVALPTSYPPRGPFPRDTELAAWSSQACPLLPTGHLFQNGSARGAAKKSASHSGGGGPQSAPAPSGPRPKPKTVSELLREKRLREARARKAAQGPAVLPPQGLLSSPAFLQPLPPQQLPVSGAVLSGPGGPAVASPGAPGPWASAKEGPPSLHALALAPASMAAGVTPAAPRAPALGPSQVPASCHLSSLGQSQAPATSRKQGLPEAPPFLPAAPSPIQLPVQPRSLTPALAAHTGASHVVASTPLPVTWVLTAQGLLPVPAVVGLPRPAGPPDPEGLSGTPPPSLTETRAGRGPKQPPAHVSVGPDAPPKTPPTAQSPAEGDGDVAHGPGGPSCPGEAQVAGEASVPRTLSPAKPLADHPEAEPCGSSQLPLPGGLSPGGAPTRHQGLERPPPPWPGPEKGAPDLRLLSQESEAAVRGWLTGQRGVCVPPLASRLPYQPPTLCSLRALSGLLLHKKALEHRAASLVPSGAAGAQQAPLGQVRERLQSSPAYLLLKARFLAAFALPALLATLPPHGVPTTLSAAAGVDSESDDDSLDELELADNGGPLGGWPSGRQAGPAAPTPTQVGGRGAEPSPLPAPPARRLGRGGLAPRPPGGSRGSGAGRAGRLVSEEEEASRLPDAVWHLGSRKLAAGTPGPPRGLDCGRSGPGAPVRSPPMVAAAPALRGGGGPSGVPPSVVVPSVSSSRGGVSLSPVTRGPSGRAGSPRTLVPALRGPCSGDPRSSRSLPLTRGQGGPHSPARPAQPVSLPSQGPVPTAGAASGTTVPLGWVPALQAQLGARSPRVAAGRQQLSVPSPSAPD